MKFTKAEQRILSSKHEKGEKVMLWMGLICLCLSISIALYFLNQTNKVNDYFEKEHQSIEQNIEPATKQEVRLKSMLLETTSKSNALWLQYFTEKIFGGALLIFTIGMFLIVSYYRSRLYTNLIQKLKNSQQANQPDAE